VKSAQKEAAGMREEMAREVEGGNRARRDHEAALVELAAVRTSEELLQTMLREVREEGAAKEEEQRKRAAIAEAELAAKKMEHAQLEGRMATSAAEVERLKAAVASVSQEVPGLKAQLHESVCARAELQGRLHAAEEEIAAFDARMKSERDELEQTRNKVNERTLQKSLTKEPY
jgi:chromosome segregation ATPase